MRTDIATQQYLSELNLGHRFRPSNVCQRAFSNDAKCGLWETLELNCGVQLPCTVEGGIVRMFLHVEPRIVRGFLSGLRDAECAYACAVAADWCPDSQRLRWMACIPDKAADLHDTVLAWFLRRQPLSLPGHLVDDMRSRLRRLVVVFNGLTKCGSAVPNRMDLVSVEKVNAYAILLLQAGVKLQRLPLEPAERAELIETQLWRGHVDLMFEAGFCETGHWTEEMRTIDLARNGTDHLKVIQKSARKYRRVLPVIQPNFSVRRGRVTARRRTVRTRN